MLLLGRTLCASALWTPAARLAELLRQRHPGLADLITARLAVEGEDWQTLDRLAPRFAHGERAADFALEQARAALRQGRAELVSSLLATHGASWAEQGAIISIRLLLLRGEATAAWHRLEPLLSSLPWSGEARALAALAQPAAAEQHWREAFARHPRLAEARCNRARHRLARGDVAGALEDARLALDAKPWLDAALQLGLQALWRANRMAEALHLADQGLAAKPSGFRAALRLDALRQTRRDAEELRRELTAAEQAWPEDPDVALPLAIGWQMLREPDRAIAAYEHRLAACPEDVAARSNLATLAFEHGERERAIELWRGFGPSAPLDVRRNLAFALLDHGEAEEALDLLRSLLASDPRDALARCGLAEALAAGGDLERAWAEAEQALALAPQSPRAWMAAARLAERREGAAAALSLLRRGAAGVADPVPLREALFRHWQGHEGLAAAAEEIAGWLAAEPNEPAYRVMWANTLFHLHRGEEALAVLRAAPEPRPGVLRATEFRLLIRLDRLEEARCLAEAEIARRPERGGAHGDLAEALYKLGRREEALAALREGMAREPRHRGLLDQLMGQLFAANREAEAVAAARQQAERYGEERDWRRLLAALVQAGRHADAISLSRTRLAAEPRSQFWRLALVKGLHHLGERAEAITLAEAAWRSAPRNVTWGGMLIDLLSSEGRYAEALEVASQLAENSVDRPDEAQRIAALQLDMGQPEAARELLERALRRQPRHLGLYRALARTLRRLAAAEARKSLVRQALQRLPVERAMPWALQEAIDLGEEALVAAEVQAWVSRAPHSMEAQWALHEWAKAFRRPALAAAALEAIERLRPGHPRALEAKVRLASEQWRSSAAIALARRLCALRPDRPEHWRLLLSEQMKAGDFSEFDVIWDRLERLWGQERYAEYSSFFFNINCHPHWSAERIATFHRDWHRHAIAPRLPKPRPHENVPDPERRLRIGYLSPDFRRHAVAYFSEPLLMGHDREQFDLVAYAHLEPGAADAHTERFRSHVHDWVEIGRMSPAELEKRIRQDRIDILVDLAGHTANNSLMVMARRPAPVQASWIFGAGQTTGLPEVDYLLGDTETLPLDFEPLVAERVLRLPVLGLPFRPADDFLEPLSPPCLAAREIVFGVLCRPLRTNRLTIRVWARILLALPQAVLRFDHVPYVEPDIQARLRDEFAGQGVGPERLRFCNTRPHWQALREIDVLLDAFPAGSGTVVSESLWMERLAVTLRSRPAMGRIGAAQLAALGLAEECVAGDEEEYVRKAVALAGNRRRLAELSHGLRERMRRSRLMDYEGYGKDVAALYRGMWRDWCRTQNLIRNSEPRP